MAGRGSREAERRSKLEDKVAAQLNALGVTYGYELPESKIKYFKPETKHTYTPDFTIFTKSGKEILIEAKGIWDSDDRTKHLLIRQQHPELDIRFVFQRATQRIRKGSKTEYKDICEGRGRKEFKGVIWKYGGNSEVPMEWMNE